MLSTTAIALATMVFTAGPAPAAKPCVPADAQYLDGWRMAGANPQRTSWVPEEVRGDLKPVFWKRIGPYISQKVQLVAADGLIFVSTARGLYALDAGTGEEQWVFHTELPLGHSPTVLDGIAYVGGFDRKIHALDAKTGKELWAFEGGAGFQVNPLIVDGVLFAGCHDGVMYALEAMTGKEVWKTDVGAMIRFSAAYSNGLIYFGDVAGHAYALDAKTGRVLWKSRKFPGAGFRSYWPVVYNDRVLFWGSNAYSHRHGSPMGNEINHREILEDDGPYPDRTPDALAGPQRDDGAIDCSAFLKYFERKPWRRTTFVLDAKTGEEKETPPVIWAGDEGACNRMVPAVGADGRIWQQYNVIYEKAFGGFALGGWEFGTPLLKPLLLHGAGGDEPFGFSAGGNMIYYNHCSHRGAGGFDLTEPAPGPAAGAARRGTRAGWSYFAWYRGDLLAAYPEIMGPQRWPFAYGIHHDRNVLVPYQGRLYMHVYNGIVALGADGRAPPAAVEVKPPAPVVTKEGLRPKTIVPGVLTHLALDDGQWPALVQRRYYTGEAPEVNLYYALCRVAVGERGPPTAVGTGKGGTATAKDADGKALAVTVAKWAPGFLCETGSSVLRIAGQFAGMAHPAADSARVFGAGQAFRGHEMSGGWILLWYGAEGHPYDLWHPFHGGKIPWVSHFTGKSPPWGPTPVLLSLQRRPKTAALGADGLRLSFDGPAGAAVLTPLYGFHDHAPRATDWAKGLPADVVRRCALLHRVSLAFPVEASDEVHVDRATGDATVTVACRHNILQDQWNTPPLRLAYLPPELALAAWGPTPIKADGELVDLDYVTILGRVAGVQNADRAQLTLPAIAHCWRRPAGPPATPIADGPWARRLAREIEKMLAAGHLRPGYFSSSSSDFAFKQRTDALHDYFHNPADTVVALLPALPFVPAELREKTKAYVRAECEKYPLGSVTHVGWIDGAPREPFALPPEVDAARSAYKPGMPPWAGWTFNPRNVYAMALYAETFGGAPELFSQAQEKLPHDARYPCAVPYVLNTHIAGHIGLLRLARAAGADAAAEVEQRLVRLLVLRAALSKYPQALADAGYAFGGYKWIVGRYEPAEGEIRFQCRAIGAIRTELDPWFPHAKAVFDIDYVNLTPEVGRFLADYAGVETRQSVASYNDRAPYWFVPFAEEYSNEGSVVPLYDVSGLFLAKAWALGEPRAELEKWIDAPGFAVGDLFYIQNVCAMLGAARE